MVDSAMFYLIGTLYPLIARATYAALSFPQYPGEVGLVRRRRRRPRRAAQQAAEAAIAEPLHVYRAFFLDGEAVHRRRRLRRSPTSASPPRSSSCARSTTPFPSWAEEYMAAIEAALGDAYAEPVADVRGYIEYVRSQAG